MLLIQLFYNLELRKNIELKLLLNQEINELWDITLFNFISKYFNKI